MAEAAELALGSSIVWKQKSYTWEEKLKMVHYYYHNGRNLYQTWKKLSQTIKTVQQWVQAKTKIRDSKKGRMRVKVKMRVQHPEMQEKLYSEYKELKKKGAKVKGWWFCLRRKQILCELQPEANFGYSDAWFSRFKKCYRLSMRRATNTRQEPADKCSAIQQFHHSIQRAAKEGDQVGPLGWWIPNTITNTDQTPLPFTFSDGSTYADTGEHSV